MGKLKPNLLYTEFTDIVENQLKSLISRKKHVFIKVH